jgi:hypothetical protein
LCIKINISRTHTLSIKSTKLDQSLVGSVVIGAKLGREGHGSVSATTIRGGGNHLMPELTPEPNSTGGESKKNKKNPQNYS